MSGDHKAGGSSKPGGRGLGRPGSSPRPAAQRPVLTPSPIPSLPSLAPQDDDGEWGEHTPIHDPLAAYKKIGQTAAMVRQLVEGEIPSLRGEVKEAVAASQNAQRESYDAKTAATLAQQRIEDVCKRVENLEPLKVNGASREVRLGTVEKKLEKASERRLGIWGMVIAILVTVLGSLGTAIWWASAVEAETAHEVQRREAADKALIEHIERRPTRDEVLTRDELRGLRDELVRQRQPTVEEWMDSLPPAKRAAARKLITETGGAAAAR